MPQKNILKNGLFEFFLKTAVTIFFIFDLQFKVHYFYKNILYTNTKAEILAKAISPLFRTIEI